MFDSRARLWRRPGTRCGAAATGSRRAPTQAGGIARQRRGQRVTVGCLDLGVDRASDAQAEGPVLAYEFGNRCDRAAVVDLGALVVTGRTEGGAEVVLVPSDPFGELQPARLEARRTGREVIEYRAVTGEAVRMACVDVVPIAGAIAGEARRALCFVVDLPATAVAEVAP